MRVYRNAKLRRLGIEISAPRPGDAGYDLVAVSGCRMSPGARVLVETGLHLEIPDGFVGLVKDRSSLALAGLHTLAGVIDSAYRGELKILLVNLADETIQIRARQRIAQLLVVPVYSAPTIYVDSLDELTKTARGAGGFGSTGE